MYLSSTTPRWQPASEADLQSALAGGLLEENHYLELKQQLDNGKGANKELARDLAQFAIDGGTLIIGIDEGGNTNPAALHPVPLAGLPERIEQIARSTVDPPLPVRCTGIPSSSDPLRGYLLVSVPATGTAPHMVDGAYYGRGEKTKQRLSDAEVLRLHQNRKNTNTLATQLLDQYVARDPVPTERRQQAHFFVIAAPVVPRTEMLLDAVHGTQWHTTFEQLKNAAMTPQVTGDGPDGGFAPSLHQAGNWSRRADGAAVTYGLTDDRRLERLVSESPRYIEDVFELELTEDGTARLMTSRLSDEPSQAGGQRIFAVMIPVLVRQVMAIANAISNHTGYLGPWMLGCAATGIAGLPAHTNDYRVWTRPWPADNASYHMTTTAAGAELAQTPGDLTRQLTGRLLRGLGEADRLTRYLTD